EGQGQTHRKPATRRPRRGIRRPSANHALRTTGQTQQGRDGQGRRRTGFGTEDKGAGLMSKILIVAEHLDGKLNSSTARCVTCARELKAESIDVLVLAADASGVAAEAAKIDGVSRVLTVSRAENAHA